MLVATVEPSELQGPSDSSLLWSVTRDKFRQPIQVQSHLETSGILVQLGRIQRT